MRTATVHDLVSLIHAAETSPPSPYASQPVGVLYESDNRDALAVLRVPAGTWVAFHDLETHGPARLEFGAGMAWPEQPPGPELVRFRAEARRDPPAADATDASDATDEPGGDGGDTDTSEGEADADGWALVFDEVFDPAELPEGTGAWPRAVDLSGTGTARWSLRFSTRRASGNPELAPAWPGFLEPRLLSEGRLRGEDEFTLADMRVSHDLLSQFEEAEVLAEREDDPVRVALLDAAKGYAAAGGSRRCLRTTAPARLAFDVEVAPGARFTAAVGMDTEEGWQHPGDGMRFAVEVDGERVWERTLAAPTEVSHRGWHPLEVDLAPWAGRRVRLELVTESLDDDAHDVGGWSHPLVRRTVEVPRRLQGEVPDVVVVLVDTLRADRLGAYGHPGGLSPNLDRTAAEGVLFRGSRSASSWTWPSTASLFTGLDPNVHGVHDAQRSYLVDGHETLAELFAREGYTTAGFSSNLLIGRADNFQQGFETFVHTPYASARAMNRRVEAWLQDTDGLARFAYIHYFDPHTPYLAPPGYEPQYPPGLRSEEELLAAYMTWKDLPPEERDSPDARPLIAEWAAHLMAQYESEVRYYDEAFGELLELLRAHGVLDDAVLVFTSDHGEEFWEHEWFSHGGHLYDETVGVPLFVTGFGPSALAPGVVEAPVGNIDVLATLAQLVDLPLPDRPLPGVSLLEAGERRAVYGQTWHGHEEHAEGFVEKRSLTAERWKLVETPSTGRVELYDLEQDPAEQRDVSGEVPPALLEALRADLRSWNERTLAEAAGLTLEADDDTLRKLRELGYLEGADDGD